ncbi:DUF305 domain-containing protein [Streptomyces sp. NBC_01102]|uniref:DUF305 domain-containing protein n=1 Tax=Streptomyces sp. NBC_01102 TaxID=2903749 RepID=UPI003868525D
MKAVRRTAVSLLLPSALLLAGLTACSAGPSPDAAPRPTAVPAPSADPTDSAWVQLMIPMDEQAVALLDLAERKATGHRLRSWAARLRTAQETELTALRGLRDRMGLPDTDVHEGHEMPGMVTARDLERARTAEGAPFDRLLVEEIRDHLRQSRRSRVRRPRRAPGPRSRSAPGRRWPRVRASWPIWTSSRGRAADGAGALRTSVGPPGIKTP